MIRSEFIVRAVLVLLFTYMLAIGATFNGILSPQFKTPTLVVMAICALGWLLIHWRRGWKWHGTALDGVFLLWIAAFGISLLANSDSGRHIAIGLWYMGVYIGVWYALQDVLANRGVRRETIADAVLIVGLIIMMLGYLQVRGWLDTQLPLIRDGVLPFDLPRPVSTIGNTNALASFLVVLIPFALGNMLSARNRLGRWIMGIYSALAVFLLFLTYSRGAWLGLLAVLVVWGGLTLAHYEMLSLSRLREHWRTLSGVTKTAIAGVGVVALVVMVVAGAVIVNSFAQPGRSIGRRTILYQPAIDLFGEKPLTGHGLFTFGQGYARLESLPPNQPHSHAHNAVLHIAAELGVIGLAALFVTVGVIGLYGWRNWRAAGKREQLVLSAAMAAVAGFAVHHLLDTPAMMPAIALTGLLALSVVLAPIEVQPIAISWRKLLQPVMLVALWIGLLLTGFWSSGLYTQYFDTVKLGLDTGDYRSAADGLQAVIDADPSLALYLQQQGFLYGLAAYEGDTEAAKQGIDSYVRALELEPQSAIMWANKAALNWQLDQQPEAIEAMSRAVELAPDSWQLAFNLATYQEGAGDIEAARALYERLWTPCRMYAEWDATELRREVWQGRTGTCVNEAVNTGKFVSQALITLNAGERDEAINLLNQAQAISTGSAQDRAWLLVGRAGFLSANGDNESAEAELQSARDLLDNILAVDDFPFGLNIAHFQFLRQAITRQFLPQVFYPTIDQTLYQLVYGG